MDYLKNIGLCWFEPRMSTYLILAASSIHRASESYWTKKALHDVFMSYNFKNDTVFSLEEEVVPTGKHADGGKVTSTSLSLHEISVM